MAITRISQWLVGLGPTDVRNSWRACPICSEPPEHPETMSHCEQDGGAPSQRSRLPICETEKHELTFPAPIRATVPDQAEYGQNQSGAKASKLSPPSAPKACAAI